jgi:hypothetical protein
MMTQADLGLNLSRKKTRKREFLEVMKRPEATGVAWHVAMRPGKRRALH